MSFSHTKWFNTPKIKMRRKKSNFCSLRKQMVEKATKKGKVPCFHISHLQSHIHFFLFIMLNNLNNKVSIHCVHIVCLFYCKWSIHCQIVEMMIKTRKILIFSISPVYLFWESMTRAACMLWHPEWREQGTISRRNMAARKLELIFLKILRIERKKIKSDS